MKKIITLFVAFLADYKYLALINKTKVMTSFFTKTVKSFKTPDPVRSVLS